MPVLLTETEKLLFKATKVGSAESVRTLLAADSGLVNALDGDSCTPLHYAAWKGHPELVTLLLDAGAEINAHNQNSHWGSTPLHAAAHGGQTAVARILIERGADVNALNPGGKTPLKETEVHNAKAVATLLRAHGAT